MNWRRRPITGRSIRLLGFAPAGNPYRPAALACCRLARSRLPWAFPLAGLRTSNGRMCSCTHSTAAWATSLREGSSTATNGPGIFNRSRGPSLSALGFLGDDRDGAAQAAAAGYISTSPALQRVDEADTWLIQAIRVAPGPTSCLRFLTCRERPADYSSAR